MKTIEEDMVLKSLITKFFYRNKNSYLNVMSYIAGLILLNHLIPVNAIDCHYSRQDKIHKFPFSEDLITIQFIRKRSKIYFKLSSIEGIAWFQLNAPVQYINISKIKKLLKLK